MLDHSESDLPERPQQIFSSLPGEGKKGKENFRRVSTGEPEGGQPRSRPLRGNNPPQIHFCLPASGGVCVCLLEEGERQSESQAARCHRFSLPCVSVRPTDRPTAGAPTLDQRGVTEAKAVKGTPAGKLQEEKKKRRA